MATLSGLSGFGTGYAAAMRNDRKTAAAALERRNAAKLDGRDSVHGGSRTGTRRHWQGRGGRFRHRNHGTTAADLDSMSDSFGPPWTKRPRLLGELLRGQAEEARRSSSALARTGRLALLGLMENQAAAGGRAAGAGLLGSSGGRYGLPGVRGTAVVWRGLLPVGCLPRWPVHRRAAGRRSARRALCGQNWIEHCRGRCMAVLISSAGDL
jgi:hypothetical protein